MGKGNGKRWKGRAGKGEAQEQRKKKVSEFELF
jgi:hypothetical protein